MDPEAVRRTVLVLLQEADALLTKLEAKHPTDRRQAGLLMRLGLAAIMGTAAFFAFVYEGGFAIGVLAVVLLSVGFAVLQSSVLALYAAYADRAVGPELGLGWPPMKYVRLMGRRDADERLVVETLIDDKGEIILGNAELIGQRRRLREAGFWLLVAGMGLVLTSMALIVGGAFVA